METDTSSEMEWRKCGVSLKVNVIYHRSLGLRKVVSTELTELKNVMIFKKNTY